PATQQPAPDEEGGAVGQADEEDDAPSEGAVADKDDIEELPAKRGKSRGDDVGDDDEDAAPKKKPDLDAKLDVRRLVISSGVKGREPVGAASTFQEGAHEKIYAFVEVGNPEQVASEIYVVFVEESSGKARRVPLKVGEGSRWRTWVFTR